MYIGKGFLVRSLRVATYLVSRGWEMRDDIDSIRTKKTKRIGQYLEFLSIEDGVRMFPPNTWNRKKAMQALRQAKNSPDAGVYIFPPVVSNRKHLE